MTSPDLLVVGGGTAALAVTRAARRKGSTSVVMVTDKAPGGDCTFTGCVPSKTLLASTHLPFAEAIARVHATIDALAAEESAEVLRGEGIEVVMGRATVSKGRRVEVNGTVYTPKNLVLATGSAPVVPGLPGLSDVPYLTNESLFELTALPRHLAVLGGGAIGCEMAEAFRRLGSEVTILEAADRLIAKEEPEASQVLRSVFEGEGISVRTSTKVESVAKSRGVLTLTTSAGPVKATHLLVAVGRRPSSQGLEDLGLKIGQSGAIEVDRRMRTGVKNVYAAGDVTGRLPFTHAADEMGRVAALNALGLRPVTFKDRSVPWVTFTDPEVAHVGLTEAQAAEQVKGARIVELPLTGVDRARTADRTDGFIKIVVGPRRLTRNLAGGRILGATIVAERAGEMLGELTLAMRNGMFPAQVAITSHAYPTWTVGVQQALGQLFGIGEREPRPAKP